MARVNDNRASDLMQAQEQYLLDRVRALQARIDELEAEKRLVEQENIGLMQRIEELENGAGRPQARDYSDAEQLQALSECREWKRPMI